eukprot:jgi/Botrbrau1/11975/Bobra.0115s0011.1
MGVADQAGSVLIHLKLVQVHEVSGAVTRLIAEDSLHVTAGPGDPRAVELRVGELAWTLTKKVPVLKIADYVYTLASDNATVFYTVIVADGVPSADVARFCQILRDFTAFETDGDLHRGSLDEAISEVERALEQDGPGAPSQPLPYAGPGGAPTMPEGTHPSIPDRIASGAQAAGTHIVAGAAWLGNMIEEQGRRLEQRVTPSQQPVHVPPAARHGLRIARYTVRKGAHAASWLVTGVASVGSTLAEHVVRRVAPQGGREPLDPNSKRGIAAASVVAAIDLYESMEGATRRVLDSTGRTTASFVSHKYGREAGDAVHDAGGAVIDAGMAAWTVSRMGVRTVAHRMAKQVVVGVAQAHVARPRPPQPVSSTVPFERRGTEPVPLRVSSPAVPAAGASQDTPPSRPGMYPTVTI